MAYLSIRVEGGLLSPDFLERIHEAQGQKPADFGLDSRGSIVDEVSAVWGDARAYWDAFQRRVARAERSSGESLTTITREGWIIPLLEALNYSITFQRPASEVDGRTYIISHRAGEDETAPPVHIVAIDQDLGSRPPAGRGTMSPHALLQDYLNRSDDHLWGIVTNGEILRLLRDSTYFTRPAYVEFDLRQMLEGERLDEFFLLYRLAQRSRLPLSDETPSDCLLESYYQDTLEQGGRIRDGLREAVSESIITLANGFLRHPRNTALRERLQSGQLTEEELYRQLLYLIYRFLFLMVAEERNLLGLDGEATADKYYRRYFSISRMRQLADEPLSAPQRFDDLYLGLRTLFRAFHDEKLAAQLGVPSLNGELFAELADLDNAYLTNRDLLQAIRLMSYFTPKDEKVRRRINYAALDVEELGSVYESLLDEHPSINQERGQPAFGFISGAARKTTGSYYTPSELVTEVIKSALVPVIEDRLDKVGKLALNSLNGSTEAKVRALLALDVCDPACGSGHFLLAAARRIGYELAKVRSGDDEPSPHMIRDGTREAITHCIYGVDKNPLAVDLCKVALWIEGHGRGKPLTFLDYRIRCGDSLVGVFDLDVLQEGIPDDAFKAVTGDDKKVAAALRKQNKEERKGQMSLLHGVGASEEMVDGSAWQSLEEMHEDTPDQVKAKAERHEALQNKQERAQKTCNLWTAAFFAPLTKESVKANQIPTTDALRRYLNGQPVDGRLTGAADSLAKEHRFFHWSLEFPQVFAKGGFDILIGNPPWVRIKLLARAFFAARDSSIASARTAAERNRLIRQLKETNPILSEEFDMEKRATDLESKFVRSSTRFPMTAVGDLNTYPLFTELSRNLISGSGRSCLIIPTGIASDNSTKAFFRDLVQSETIVSLTGFTNWEFIFPGVGDRFSFCLLTVAGSKSRYPEPRFVFHLHNVNNLNDHDRFFKLSKEELALVNPSTLGCPIFRTGQDAELTKKIYRRYPVFVLEEKQQNIWNVSFIRMFDMSNDSDLFFGTPANDRLPLIEAKMFWHYDHRYGYYTDELLASKQGSYRSIQTPDTIQRQDPEFSARPRFYVPKASVKNRAGGNWTRGWFLCYRDITLAVNERTAIASVAPFAGIAHTAPVIMVHGHDSIRQSCLLANFCALVFDYVARIKIGGTHLSYFILKQLPMLSPQQYISSDIQYIVPRVLEMVYTARDLSRFADGILHEADDTVMNLIRERWRDNQHATGEHVRNTSNFDAFLSPFMWHDDRRAEIQAELDAYFARLYCLTRTELRYILDPADVYGLDFPGETFRVLKNKEIKKYGEYRTQRLVLEAWDTQQESIDSGDLPWDHPDPGPSVVGPNAQPASSVTIRSHPVVRSEVAKSESQARPSASAKAQKPAPVKRAEQPRHSQANLLEVQLPDLSIASEGTFSQRLKRVQKLSKNPSPSEITELTVYLAAPESSIRWLASATLSKIGGPQVEAALRALLEEEISEEVQQEVLRILENTTNIL